MTTVASETMSAEARRRVRVLAETYADVQDVRIRTEQRIATYADHEGLVAVVGELDAERLRREGMEVYRAAVREKKTDPAFLEASAAAASRLADDKHHKKVNKLMRDQEAALKAATLKEIAEHPLWKGWLKYVYGIGPCIAGGLIARINIERCENVSQLWKYAGLGVTIDAWKCHACSHEIPHHPSFQKRGEEARVACPQCKTWMAPVGHADRRVKGQLLTYNPALKTLFWKAGESFVKQSAEKSQYRRLYDRFRAEIDGQPCSKVHKDDQGKVVPCFDAHRFAKAKRKVVKVFAAHVYMMWRKALGLRVADPWIFWKEHDRASFIEPLFDKPQEGEGVED